LGTGGSEISDWGLLKYISKENGYIIKHSRDYREIIQDRPAIILAQQYAIKKGVELAAELNIPIIITQHGHNQWGHASLNNYLIFNSYHVAADELVKADFKHYDIVYPRIDLLKFKPTGLNVDYSTRKFITFIGRPDKIKGIELFMQIATALPNMSFLFVGGQPAEDIVVPNNVEVRNFTFQPELVYAQSRIVLVPSQYEPFGMVAVEASICGVPVVSSALPGLREATSDLSNYVDSLDNVDMWLIVINKVLNDYEHHCSVAYKIASEYERKHAIQLNKFKCNVERLIDGKQPTPYTRYLKFSLVLLITDSNCMKVLQSILDQTYTEWDLMLIVHSNRWTEMCEFHRNHSNYNIVLIQDDTDLDFKYYADCSGEFVIYLHSEVVLLPNALEILKCRIWKSNCQIISFKSKDFEMFRFEKDCLLNCDIQRSLDIGLFVKDKLEVDYIDDNLFE
jgi:hypothetical protein